MDNGKVKEAILKRSIFKTISYMKPETAESLKTGNDAAALKLSEDKVTVISTNPVTYTFNSMEKLVVASAVNNVAVRGAKPVSIDTCILLPERYKETALKKMIENLHIACNELNIYISGGHTEVTPAVISPVISVTAVGMADSGKVLSVSDIKPGMDIVICGYIGLAGSAIILDKKGEDLRKRFCDSFLDGMNDFENCYSIAEEAAVAVNSGVTAMHDVSRGGIMKALWEMAETADVGIEVNLDNIPIRQQTIELCEYYNLNPYEMMSTGAVIMVTEDGAGLVSELSHRGYAAEVAGQTTDSNDRVFIRNEERAFITPPKGDEIYKIFQKGNEK